MHIGAAEHTCGLWRRGHVLRLCRSGHRLAFVRQVFIVMFGGIKLRNFVIVMIDVIRRHLGAFVTGFIDGFEFFAGLRVFILWPVGHGNAEIVRMYFGKGQEAVTVAAVFDKSRLKRRLDPHHFGKIDVAAENGFACQTKIEII